VVELEDRCQTALAAEKVLAPSCSQSGATRAAAARIAAAGPKTASTSSVEGHAGSARYMTASATT
jgi:hypothetical protein